jgi:hypothetical protein
MSLIVPKASRIPLQKIWTRETADASIYYRLFKNDYTPNADTVLGDLMQADFTGYAEIEINTPVTQVALDATFRAVTIWAMITWTKSGATGNTIYGYYARSEAGELLWAERFTSGAYAMSVDGQTLPLYPTLTYTSQF